MKRTFKTIMTALIVSLLFVSCNADMKDMGIFNTIKHSKPSTSYKVSNVSGAFPEANLFIIETEDGIQTISPDSETRNTLVSGLHASMKFVDGNYIYYTVKIAGENDNIIRRAELNAEKTSATDSKVVKLYIQDGKEIEAIENSFYEDGKYILKVRDVDGKYHFISDVTTSIKDDTSYTFKKESCHAVTDTKSAPVYIGNGYYYVFDKNSKEYNIYDFAGSITLDEKLKSKAPLAMVGNYLFLSDGSICTIAGTNATLSSVKHTITYLQPNHAIPMTEFNGKICGVFGAKPFVFDGAEFKEHGYIAEISVIDVIKMNGHLYAVSANSGIFVSDDGVSYEDSKLKSSKSF